ncbi:MAG TPA: hypothetical protein PLY36_04305 [Spirochaetota bacterium]|nr:hypothetical protein [Spirochaetota bacterium]
MKHKFRYKQSNENNKENNEYEESIMTENTSLRDSFIYNIAMFLFSFSIMALETIFMHQLLIVTNYITATFVISIAMIGIAAGGFLSFYLSRIRGYAVMLIASLLFMVSIPLSYYNIVRIGEYSYPYFLVLPFLFGAIIVSLLFSRGNSNKIYFTNLVASAAGVIFPIISVSTFKSENSLILLMFIPAIFILTLTVAFRNIFLKLLAAAISIPLIFGVWFVFNENMKLPAEFTKTEFEQKIIPSIKSKFDKDFMLSKFTLSGDKYVIGTTYYEKMRAKYILNDIGYSRIIDPQKLDFLKKYGFVDCGLSNAIDLNYNIKPDEKNKIDGRKTWASHMKFANWKLVYSGDDLMGKIDLFAVDNNNIFFCTNGIPLDTVDKGNGTIYDPRVPQIDNPKIFIIGLSYDGIVKSAKRQEGARVSGVEFSPIIMDIMMENNKEGYFSVFGNYPYKGLDAYHAEGRYFLSSNNETYDMITLMNLHYEYPSIATLAPEYLHTVEATKMMLNKLSDKGMVVYEEIIETKRARLSFYKFLNTLKQSMKEMGIKNPDENIIIYAWDFWGTSKQFQTILIKKSPFTDKELSRFAAYHSVIAPKYGSVIFLHPRMKTGHPFETYFRAEPAIYYIKDYPDGLSKKEYESDILANIEKPEDKKFFEEKYKYSTTYSKYYLQKKSMTDTDNKRLEAILNKVNFPYELDLSPVTDNNPYPFNIYKNKKEVRDFLNIILKIAGVMLIPVLLLAVFKYGSQRFRLLGHTVFFGLLGLGFMLIEIVLMQKYQNFIGSPIYSTIVIFGGLLFFSGLGSFFSRNFGKKILVACICVIPLLILFQAFFIGDIFQMFAKFSFHSKLFIASGLIFPLAFLMGMPFPHAMEQVKQDVSNEYATLMFGVNGVLATVGASLSIFLNVSYGMNYTLMIGFATYVAAILLFIVIKKAA